ncbi:hypothetical protein [Pedobacter faecalis]|uniref:hypothetical protein n=1 Tax=Pedobacter faecalis TaxID=3041495 RepID=UPI00254CA0A7|nr:hypothetical protein [Pedobacter sp. ELA7]
MKATKSVSIRSILLGESVTFLSQENMNCLITQDGLVELISQLVYYKEEGKSLYPEIYIFDEIELIKKVLPLSQFCTIGEGGKTKETMLTALKKCAPLTEGGWAIYILRKVTTFQYGVFKAGSTILSVSISQTLIDAGTDELKAILIHQVADRLIEVKGVTADSLIISFGSHDGSAKSPIKIQDKFIDAILKNVNEDIKEQARNFYQKIFLEVLQKGHGTLACVINSNKKELPKKLSDGIILPKTINVVKTISDLLEKNDLQANSVLEGQFSLISGMMQSDGITVFKNNGSVVAYNVFVKHPAKVMKTATSGGARSRTFITLTDLIGSGIESAYLQSQDGNIEVN